MTTTPTREQLASPVVAAVRSNGLVQPRVATQEALEVLNKKPINTVWSQTYGLPIYGRLPGIEQAYKIEAGPDSAYVYIEPNFPKYEGPGSIQPGRLASDFSVFVMESGEITWSSGSVSVDRLSVDITKLGDGGLKDGQYKAGYLMEYAQPTAPPSALGRVENALIGDADVGYAASSQAVGHPDFFALSENPRDAWWAKEDTSAGFYADGSSYTLDLRAPVQTDAIKFVGQSGERATATMAVYYSDDAIIWYKETQVSPVGETWTFTPSASTAKHRYWRFFFWGGYVTVGNILYTGEAFFPDSRRLGPVNGATPFIDDLFEEITQVHLLVGTFTVQDGKIVETTDQRRFLQRKYEPVAQWLTSFEDLMLRCYFEDIEQYAALYMAPPTADYHFYQELDTNACSGEGVIDVGTWTGGQTITFPDEVGLTYDVAVNPSETYELPSFYVSDTLSLLDADIYEFDPGSGLPILRGETLLANGIITIPGPGGIKPNMVDFVAPPTLESDLANKSWTDSALQTGQDLDNGIY
jgi:hypothetical protein